MQGKVQQKGTKRLQIFGFRGRLFATASVCSFVDLQGNSLKEFWTTTKNLEDFISKLRRRSFVLFVLFITEMS